VLSVDLYLEIEKDRRGQSFTDMVDTFSQSNTESFVAEMENIHNKAIFDAINEALDGFRPYGLKGPPLPWSNQQKLLTLKYGGEDTVDILFQRVKVRVMEWAQMRAGLSIPRRAGPGEQDRLEMEREERLTRILQGEADENEGLWVDYEYEETQTKLDVADIVLN